MSCLRSTLFFLFFILLLSQNVFGQKIVGYFPSYRDYAAGQVEFNKLTDVYFAFLNFDPTTGNLDLTNQPQLTTVITAAKASNPNIRIHISTGGGGFAVSNFNTMVSNATARANFVSSMVNYIQTNNLDGWNLDWEYPTSATEINYHELLLKDMSTAMKAKEAVVCKKLDMTIAVDGVSSGDYLNLNSVNYVDYLIVMSYDAPSFLYANHTSYAMAQNALDGWNAWGVPYSKMILAVPFYGWDSGRGTAMTYSQIAAPDPVTVYNSTTDLYGGQYYNAAPAIRSKIDLVMRTGKRGAGMAIWELGQDRAGMTYSLLDAIYQKFLTSYAISGLPANPCSMPVVFEEIQLKMLDDDKVEINWYTSFESNINEYLIQRSENGIDFTAVATRRPSNDNGLHNYTVVDVVPDGSSMIYYKIIEVDNDFVTTSSAVQSIKVNGSNKLEIYPNPSQGEIVIKNNHKDKDIVKFEIISAQGNVVLSEEKIMPTEFYRLDMSSLKQGVYLINFYFSDSISSNKIEIK